MLKLSPSQADYATHLYESMEMLLDLWDTPFTWALVDGVFGFSFDNEHRHMIGAAFAIAVLKTELDCGTPPAQCHEEFTTSWSLYFPR